MYQNEYPDELSNFLIFFFNFYFFLRLAAACWRGFRVLMVHVLMVHVPMVHVLMVHLLIVYAYSVQYINRYKKCSIIYSVSVLFQLIKEGATFLWELTLGWHVMTYISLERSHRVEQLCPLAQSDLRTTGGARGRQSRKFFWEFF